MSPPPPAPTVGGIAPHNAQSPFNGMLRPRGSGLPELAQSRRLFDDFLEPWSRDIMTGSAIIRDGYIELPGGPGFGVGFVHDAMADHPYSPQNFLRLFSPGWEQRAGDR